MYQPAALFIGLRYMCAGAQPTASVVRLLALNYRCYAWRNGAGTVLSVMNGFERELQNNIPGLMPQAILSAKQGSGEPSATAGARSET